MPFHNPYLRGHVTTLWQVMWQHCDRSCDNIVTDHVTTLWQVMWQHHDKPCDNIATGHVTTMLWQHCDRSCGQIVTGQWQHHDRSCDNIVTDQAQHHDRPCDNIVTGQVKTLWQAMWQHCHRLSWKITMISVLKLTQSNLSQNTINKVSGF